MNERKGFTQMNLGNKLLDLRKQSKLTQEEVADRLMVTRQTISNWELNQTKPDIDQTKGLSKLYNISIDELIDNDIKEILTKKVSNVEKLAGLIYTILKIVVILFISAIILSIIGVALLSGIRKSVVVETEITTTLTCELNNEKYEIKITTIGDDNEITEIGGSSKLINILDLEKYQYMDQLQDKVTSYIETNGGNCN